jgi:hypothetical protein
MGNIFSMDWNNGGGGGERRENISHIEFREISLSTNFYKFQILSVGFISMICTPKMYSFLE